MAPARVPNHRICTRRLRLTPIGLADLEEVAELHADERVWGHFPSGRHSGLEQTHAWVLDRRRRWSRDGLGYWTACLRQPAGGLSGEAFAGVGGCELSTLGNFWNLYYRLRPELHRRGLANEPCEAALDAARRTSPELPVVASLLEHNRASAATAERAGLQLVWRGPDVGNPDTGAVRLFYADRPLDRNELGALTRSSWRQSA